MQPKKISLRQLAQTPRPLRIELCADWLAACIRRGHPDVEQVRDGCFQGRGYLTSQGAVIQGRIELEFTAVCSRCLGPIDVRAQVPCRWIASDVRELIADDLETLPVDGSGQVDLAAPMAEAIDLNLPSVLLCSNDCRGLCARCGADLNRGPCGCSIGPKARQE
ncbi:MAG: DUF177 domain-containing protein [Candidatus Alcyoniella australis]|nr:DUF177 domain-containing protein [Candidatus Alcyoniella australis]